MRTPPSDPYPAPISARILKIEEVFGLVLALWPASEWVHAVTVAQCESELDTGAHNTAGEDSRGLWQINVARGAHPELAEWNLWDPQLNAYWAHRIWSESGWSAWYN